MSVFNDLEALCDAAPEMNEREFQQHFKVWQITRLLESDADSTNIYFLNYEVYWKAYKKGGWYNARNPNT